MSSLIVEITEVLKTYPIKDADFIELIKVKGWQVISQKGHYSIGDKVIYCPIDAVLPLELSEALGITKYLSNGRVRTNKMRGVYSQGLLIPLEFLPKESSKELGTDVCEVLKITKYEPPASIGKAGNAALNNEKFFKYTNIENIKNFPNVLKEDEKVIITEKLHGTNFRAALIDGELLVGSHNVNLKNDPTNLYWQIALHYKLDKILPEGYQLFGEIYGKGVQKLDYAISHADVRFFDLIVDNSYVEWNIFKQFCNMNNLPMVPELYCGFWNTNLLNFAEGHSTLAKHIREGIVIKPQKERWDNIIGRVILKHINEKYLMKDYGDLH